MFLKVHKIISYTETRVFAEKAQKKKLFSSHLMLKTIKVMNFYENICTHAFNVFLWMSAYIFIPMSTPSPNKKEQHRSGNKVEEEKCFVFLLLLNCATGKISFFSYA
jgi:hypothetical protein